MNFIYHLFNCVRGQNLLDKFNLSYLASHRFCARPYFFKVYNEDVSLNSIRCMDNRYDLTHNLENIVYNELEYMGYKLYVYDNKGKKVDSLAIKDNKKYFIQVAYSFADEKAYNREFSAFQNINNLSQKIIITNDDIDYSTSVVKHIKLKDSLLIRPVR